MMLKIFKIVAFIEGSSYLLLLFIGVPLKYMLDNNIIVKLLGKPHGFLFIAYVIIAIWIKQKMKWNFKTLLIIIVASILPFGTFWMDKKYLREKH